MRLIDADKLVEAMTGACNIQEAQGMNTSSGRTLIAIARSAPTVVRDGMNKFNANWADQLRAGALNVAKNAEKIVGELERNMELTVSIHLFTNTDEINWPYISIHRKISSAQMNKAMRDYYNRDGDRKEAQEYAAD